MRAAHPCERSSRRSPGSQTESFCACQGLRPRRVAGARENAPSNIAFHVVDRVGTREFLLTRLNTWPAHSPTDASPPASRLDTHGLGSMWIALPSLQWTFTTYSLPVSRRTGNYVDTHRPGRSAPLGGRVRSLVQPGASAQCYPLCKPGPASRRGRRPHPGEKTCAVSECSGCESAALESPHAKLAAHLRRHPQP
jgi:hypothetical protein